MEFVTFHNSERPTVMLIPGLGVSYEIFMPLVELLKSHYNIVAVQVDGFTLGRRTSFTTIDHQAAQVIDHINERYNGRVDCIYGLSMGGKILSRILERDEVVVAHAIMDAAPLIALPHWLVGPLRYLQCANVWSCFYMRGFWRWVFGSRYFDVLLDECRKTYPWGGGRAVLDGYKSVYASTLRSLRGGDVHYWYGTKEAFVARPQVRHLLRLCPKAHVEMFRGMNHGQLLIECPEEIARRIEIILQ
ncbi:MAG: alpha/beta hydrolase [Rikenellaceae bacterium]|nr:alpha/beta hydrolase [Rikenellaceae bacterium]